MGSNGRGSHEDIYIPTPSLIFPLSKISPWYPIDRPKRRVRRCNTRHSDNYQKTSIFELVIRRDLTPSDPYMCCACCEEGEAYCIECRVLERLAGKGVKELGQK
jgi:hypothetical protein